MADIIMKTLTIGDNKYIVVDAGARTLIGDLTSLDTTAKNNLVAAINEALTRTGPTDQQVQDAVDAYLDDHPTISGTFTNEAKYALLALLEKVAYIDDDGQTYYNALESELYAVTVTSISAEFTQGQNVIYDTDILDTLRQYLVVTANYSDGTSAIVTTYSLSGTLTEGTSTITVTYGEQTDTFTVTVSIGLDSIAYGTTTYRQMFITNNKAPKLSEFENSMTISNTAQTFSGTNETYRAGSGTPVRSTTKANSPTHSLKCFASGTSVYLNYINDVSMPSGKYIVAIAVKCDRYSSGNAGFQFGAPKTGAVDKINAYYNAVSDDFVGAVGLVTLTATRSSFYAYIGAMTSADLDCYVDDFVVTPVPSSMTQAEAETLYGNYLIMRRGA